MKEELVKLIDVREIVRQKVPEIAPKIPNFLMDYLTRLIHQDELNDIQNQYKEKEGVDFMNSLITYFDLTIQQHGELPSDGRYIFASNHPLGGMDGICLSSMVGNHFNGKVRYLVNDMLLHIQNLKSIFVPINKHGAQNKENAQLIEAAYASDNQIITFPAGLCSRKTKGKIMDLEWKKSFIQKAVQYQRDIVPIYFNGMNSARFYRLANWRKALGIRMNYEMILLPDEMFRAKHQTFSIYIGQPIPWQTFDNSRTPQQWAEWVKQLVYNLKDSIQCKASSNP